MDERGFKETLRNSDVSNPFVNWYLYSSSSFFRPSTIQNESNDERIAAPLQPCLQRGATKSPSPSFFRSTSPDARCWRHASFRRDDRQRRTHVTIRILPRRYFAPRQRRLLDRTHLPRTGDNWPDDFYFFVSFFIKSQYNKQTWANTKKILKSSVYINAN